MTSASAAQIGAIHTIAKRLGLDEDTRRELIASVAGGKRSSRELTSGEAIRVIDRLKTIQGGGAGATATGARTMDGDYAPKLRALWLSGWHLGVVSDRTDAALLAFLERQTGLSHSRFLRDPKDARKVIEALKAWLARAAGVEWPTRAGADQVHQSKCAVHDALRSRLQAAGADITDMPHPGAMTEAEIDAEIRAGGALLRRLLKGGNNRRKGGKNGC